MDVTRLEQCAYIKIVILQGRIARKFHSELVQERIVLHGLHKLTVAFSIISPLQYGYSDIGMLF